ncbi:MAG: hypothetical protein LBL56_04815 [Treponema sp.]|nr:hypothetical protein [Treponema sp.]
MNHLKGYHQAAVSYSSWGPYSNNEWLFTDDGFVIGEALTTFTYYDAGTGDIGFAGTIVGIIAEDPSVGSATDGRIFIKITDGGAWYKTLGSYYAVIYKNLTEFGVTEGGASKYGDYTAEENNGLPTLQEAITEYAYSTSTTSGYFSSPGNYYTKTVLPNNLSAALQGTWYYEDYDMYVVIRGNTFLSFMDGYEEYDEIYAPDNDEEDMLAIAGEIVDYIDNGTSGILYVRTVVAGDWGYQNDKYEAIAWKGLNGNTIRFYAQMDNTSSLSDAKTAYTDPNDTSQFLDNGFDDYVKQ